MQTGQSKLDILMNAENYVLLPVKWFRYYLQKTNKITSDVLDKEIKPHFDESFMGMRIMFEDYDPIPQEIQDFYYHYSHIFNECKKEIEIRYKNYIQTLIPIEVNLDLQCHHCVRTLNVYDFTKKDTEKLMKIRDINNVFENAYQFIKHKKTLLRIYMFKVEDKLPVEMWKKGDRVRWWKKNHYVEKVCKKIVKCKYDMALPTVHFKKIKDIINRSYYVIRNNNIVKYNTEQGEYNVSCLCTKCTNNNIVKYNTERGRYNVSCIMY